MPQKQYNAGTGTGVLQDSAPRMVGGQSGDEDDVEGEDELELKDSDLGEEEDHMASESQIITALPFPKIALLTACKPTWDLRFGICFAPGTGICGRHNTPLTQFTRTLNPIFIKL